MVKFPWSCTSVLFLMVWTVSVETRPQLIEALNKVTEELLNDTTIGLIQTLAPQANVSRSNGTRNKTRILFRGDLLTDFGDQDIIFPDSYQVIHDHIPKINAQPKCANGGRTFCENFDSYPYQHVKDVLERKHVFNGLFGKDEIPDDRYSITNRNGDIETFVCPSIQKTIFPRAAKNKNNKWKYVINQAENEGYIQGIRIELCRKEGSACDLISERANGYITSCKQKYMLRRMMSLNDNFDPVADTFQLPSACCCSYRKDLGFLSRFGVEDISARKSVKTKIN